MKIKNNGLENYPRSPYIPKVEPNLFFAGKKVKTSYKEYEVLIDNNNIGLGKFKKNVVVIPEDIINFIKEYDDMARDFRTKKSLDETTKTLWHNILFFSGCECFVTTYNEQGLVTSYEVDDFVFVFKYNEQQQLTEWTATISDQISCTYSFLYNEKGLLYKITEKIPTGIFKEYLYDKKGDMVAVVEDGYIDEYQYSYNSKGELVRLKHYLNEKVQNEDLLLYDERGNKTLFCSFREENEEDEDEDRRKVFINSYKNGRLAKQEILYYENGNKEFLFFDEQGNIIEKQYFEMKPYQGFELLYTLFYKYFDGKVERTQINEDFKEIIVCKDIAYEEESYYRGWRSFWRYFDKTIHREYDSRKYNSILFSDNIFSYATYDKEDNEIREFARTYLTNGECETIFYRNGTPEYIVKKECTIV
ncbi:hypothetical protein, partial [uncultured Capnocytophaga sp.]|uniref:hypothetical protein n=1 Tax=uncultured Capnocytophaga sp. TaxID=159273 RepID=UPI0025965A94